MKAKLFVSLSLLALTSLLVGAVSAQGSGPQVPPHPAEMPHPILSDIKVRRAIAYCTDKDALLASVYPDATPEQRQAWIADTFIPKSSWAYTPPTVTYPYSPTVGQSLLDEAGWTLPPGAQYRTKDGKELVLMLTTTTSSFRVTYLTVFEAQMKACGIHIIRNHQPASWWFGRTTGLQVRDFELGAFAWVTSDEYPGSPSIYACDSIPLPTNNWSGQNYMGWCNQTASDAIAQAINPQLPQDQRKTFYATVINALAEDIPTLPLFWREGSSIWEHIDFNLQTFAQEQEIDPGGVALTYTDYNGNQHTIVAPSGSVTQTITLKYYPLVSNANPPSEGMETANAFRLNASINGVPQSTFSFVEPLTVTVSYTTTDIVNIFDENSLALYYWDKEAGSWIEAVETCPVAKQFKRLDIDQNLFEVSICHLTEFALMGTKNNRVYLPSVMR